MTKDKKLSSRGQTIAQKEGTNRANKPTQIHDFTVCSSARYLSEGQHFQKFLSEEIFVAIQAEPSGVAATRLSDGASYVFSPSDVIWVRPSAVKPERGGK